MPSWLVSDVSRSIAAQMLEAAQASGNAANVATYERLVLDDIHALVNGGLIAPRASGDGPEQSVSKVDLERITHYTSADDDGKKDYLAELAEHQRVGRYTLAEAADAIEKATGERYEAVLERIVMAALQDLIGVYEGDSTLRCDLGRPPLRRRSLVHASHHSTYWDQLNGWLATKETLIEFRFPIPGARAGQAKKLSKVSSQQQWNDRFISAIKELGLDPNQLPASSKGATGVRSRVKSKLGISGENKAFEHAWDRAKAAQVFREIKRG